MSIFAGNDAGNPEGTGKVYCVYDKPAPAVAAAGNLIVGGSFEDPPVEANQYADSYSAANLMPPGWTVLTGSVDWGKYTGNNVQLTSAGAADGSQFMDLCGRSGARGKIASDSFVTVADTVYTISLDVNVMGSGQADDVETANVLVGADAASLAVRSAISASKCGGWPEFPRCWRHKKVHFKAAGAATVIGFEATGGTGACITIDDIKVAPANAVDSAAEEARILAAAR